MFVGVIVGVGVDVSVGVGVPVEVFVGVHYTCLHPNLHPL